GILPPCGLVAGAITIVDVNANLGSTTPILVELISKIPLGVVVLTPTCAMDSLGAPSKMLKQAYIAREILVILGFMGLNFKIWCDKNRQKTP
ncbi:MAG TPA: hypothetical protein DCS66_25095, partial [Flavobacteriaceae bacterium]|nr:hypothetical protein [Flavobacteriaceae bacterium]